MQICLEYTQTRVIRLLCCLQIAYFNFQTHSVYSVFHLFLHFYSDIHPEAENRASVPFVSAFISPTLTRFSLPIPLSCISDRQVEVSPWTDGLLRLTE